MLISQIHATHNRKFNSPKWIRATNIIAAIVQSTLFRISSLVPPKWKADRFEYSTHEKTDLIHRSTNFQVAMLTKSNQLKNSSSPAANAGRIVISIERQKRNTRYSIRRCQNERFDRNWKGKLNENNVQRICNSKMHCTSCTRGGDVRYNTKRIRYARISADKFQEKTRRRQTYVLVVALHTRRRYDAETWSEERRQRRKKRKTDRLKWSNELKLKTNQQL